VGIKSVERGEESKEEASAHKYRSRSARNQSVSARALGESEREDKLDLSGPFSLAVGDSELPAELDYSLNYLRPFLKMFPVFS
jgi:hypothetical protein